MNAKLSRMPVSQRLAELEAKMRQAEEVGDIETWLAYSSTWLGLVPLRIREITVNRLVSEIYAEEVTALLFHPLVG